MRRTCAGALPNRRMATHEAIAMNRVPSRQAARGSALMNRDAMASTASVPYAMRKWREGRQSMRKLDDDLDNGLQLRIGGPFAAHAPLPELIVLAIEQP